MADRTIDKVLADNSQQWMSIPGVVGTARGRSAGKVCIVIFAAGDADLIRDEIGPTVEGYPVIVETTGDFHAL